MPLAKSVRQALPWYQPSGRFVMTEALKLCSPLPYGSLAFILAVASFMGPVLLSPPSVLHPAVQVSLAPQVTNR